MKKFRKRIQKFENCEMDQEMDLKKGKCVLRKCHMSSELKVKLIFSSAGKNSL